MPRVVASSNTNDVASSTFSLSTASAGRNGAAIRATVTHAAAHPGISSAGTATPPSRLVAKVRATQNPATPASAATRPPPANRRPYARVAWLGASGATVEAQPACVAAANRVRKRRHLRQMVAPRRHDLGQDVEVLWFHDDVRPAVPILTGCLAVVHACRDDQPGVT